MEEKSLQISFSPETLQTRGITVDGLKHFMDHLSKLLKNKFLEIIPTRIFDTQSLDRILMLHEVLSGIEDVGGIDRHLKEYSEPQFLSTLFVSRLALFLKDKVDDIELEPITKENEGNPDIRIEKNDTIAYIECKNIETSRFNSIEEHRNVFETLEKYIDAPHQISFSYRRTPTTEQLDELGQSINNLLKHVTNSGHIINNEYFEVHVQIRDGYGDRRISGIMEMIIEDTNSGERKPGHVFLENGKTIAIQGPQINYKKIIQDKIKDARNQSVPGEIFITAINSDLMLGSITDNIRYIEAIFQPNQNTRYSAVILANSQSVVGEEKWYTISNPYASVPMVVDIERLFRN